MSARLVRPLGSDDHVTGVGDAPVTLVEYGDFECPYCAAAFPIVKAIQERMGDRLRFAFRHFPLTQMHPHAQHAAETAEAAAQHGKFWEMHDTLFENRDALEDEDLVSYAAALGIDPTWTASALADGTFESRVRRDFIGGARSGANGTPTFFINGVRDDSGTWTDPEQFLQTLEGAALSGVR